MKARKYDFHVRFQHETSMKSIFLMKKSLTSIKIIIKIIEKKKLSYSHLNQIQNSFFYCQSCLVVFVLSLLISAFVACFFLVPITHFVDSTAILYSEVSSTMSYIVLLCRAERIASISFRCLYAKRFQAFVSCMMPYAVCMHSIYFFLRYAAIFR